MVPGSPAKNSRRRARRRPWWFRCFSVASNIDSSDRVLVAALDDTASPYQSSPNRALSPPFRLAPKKTPAGKHPAINAVLKRSTVPGAPGHPAAPSSFVSPAPSTLPSIAKLRNAASDSHKRTDSAVYSAEAWGSPPRANDDDRQASLTNPEPPETVVSSMPSGSQAVTSYTTEPTSASLTSEHLSHKNRGSFDQHLDKSQSKGASSNKEFTQEWIDQFMSGEPRTERHNWLSDDSGDGLVPSFVTSGGNRLSGVSDDDWLGLDDSRPGDSKTSKASKILGREIKDLQDKKIDLPKLTEKLLPKKNSETADQSDFWDFGYDPDAVPATMTDIGPAPDSQPESADPGLNSSVSPIEKPLPPRPNADEEGQTAPSPVSPIAQPSKPTPPVKPAQRSKKKIVWRGKACVIAFPVNDIRGTPEHGGPLFTTADLEKRLEQWNDISVQPDPMAGGSQSCATFPDPDDTQEIWEQRKFPVRFPNKGEWDAYVNHLQEEKLRALGVSLGDEEGEEEDESQEPAPTGQDPMQILSPPLPTSSVNSNHMSTVANPFSPAFNQPGQGGSGIGSQTSPSSPFGVLANSPFSNQQFHFGNDQQQLPAGSGAPFYPLQQPTPPVPGNNNFTPQSYFPNRQGGVSPLASGALPNLGSMLGPVSPLTSEDVKHFPPTSTPPPQGSHPLANQFQPSQYGEDAGVEGEHEPETYLTSSVPEIAHPTPRGHRHNLSETLQKGVERAETEIEDTMRRTLDDEQQGAPESDLMKSRWAVPEDNEVSQQSFRQPDPKAQSEALQSLFGERREADEESDINTNPSLAARSPGPAGESTNAPNSHQAADSATSFGQHSGMSGGRFNVGAQSFDPTASFSPTNFSFTGNSFQPASSFNGPASMFTPGYMEQAPSHASVDSFNRGDSTQQPFTAGRNNDSISSNTNFQFSSLSFNVDAPVFNPGRGLKPEPPSSSAAASGTTAAAPKIFDSIPQPSSSSATQSALPTGKRSKAIPIVPPDEKKTTSEREGQGREKRSRRGGQDDDQDDNAFVPQDKPLPTPPIVPSSHEPEDKELDDNVSERSTVPDDSVKPKSSVTEEQASNDQTAPSFKPFEFKIEKDAVAFNDARPASPAKSEEKSTENIRTTNMEKAAPLIPEKVSSPLDKELPPIPPPDAEDARPKTALKPDASPFEFKPSIDVQPLPERKPEPQSPAQPSSPPAPKQGSGLMASRYAVISPPSSPKSKEGLAQSAQRSSPAEQGSVDDNEIDAVMQELNDGDSTLGVERRETHPPAQEPATDDHILHKAPQSTAQSEHSLPSPRERVPRIKTDLNARSQPVLSPQRTVRPDTQSPVRHLNKPELEHVSDWDDAFSQGEEGEVHRRSRFFDRHVNDIIGGILEDRLFPLERTLGVIQHSVGTLASSTSPIPHHNQTRRLSAGAKESDADDEDEDEEETGGQRPLSPLDRRERRLDRIKQVVLEALSSREASQSATPPAVNLSGVEASLAELKELTVSKAEMDRRSEFMDAISELKELFVTRPDQSSEVKQALSELKELAVSNSEPNMDLKDEISGLKHVVLAKSEYDQNSEVKEIVSELKELSAARPEHDKESLKAIIAEALSGHPTFNQQRERSGDLDDDAEKFKLQIDGLQNMLRIAEDRADGEYNGRRRTQDALAEAQRQLKLAQEETSTIRQEFQEFKDSKLPEVERVQEESTSVKEQQESLHLALNELSDKNISLRSALEEMRTSRDRITSEAEESKAENKDFRRTISLLKEQMENDTQSRQSLREKFERLQEDMISATQDIAKDQSTWRKKEEDHITKYNTLQTSYEQEVKQRKKLELHINDLEDKEKDALRMKHILRQSQEENAKLEELLMNIRQESHDHQSRATRFERELTEAGENSHREVQAVRTSLEYELETAKHQANMARSDMESQISTLETRLMNSQLDAETANEKHQLLLNEAKESKTAALRDATESKDMALQEQRLAHERTLNDLRERHARALHNASEDRQRDESHHAEVVALRDEKIDHLSDKVAHLEEKLEVANSAARAAAQAAQTSKNPPALMSPTSPSMTFTQGSSVPEKISPQALRESIMVLQDQLQQREGRIETLEQELSSVDKEAPNKLKEKETEINWLRELLGVRTDDLQDIINTLSQRSFNQHAVRDAAIRLKANLQMQQQEKERAMAGGNQPFPSLSSISNLASSPRALPMAAAAAWGNWRKTRDNSVASASSSGAPDVDNDQTPTRAPQNSQGLFSGLMTPPSSNLRQGPPPNQSAPQPQRSFNVSRPLRASSGDQRGGPSERSLGKSPQTMEPPTTPPLLRKSSYDRDAESANYEDSSYGDDDESLMGGIISREPQPSSADEPFGPAI